MLISSVETYLNGGSELRLLVGLVWDASAVWRLTPGVDTLESKSPSIINPTVESTAGGSVFRTLSTAAFSAVRAFPTAVSNAVRLFDAFFVPGGSRMVVMSLEYVWLKALNAARTWLRVFWRVCALIGAGGGAAAFYLRRHLSGDLIDIHRRLDQKHLCRTRVTTGGSWNRRKLRLERGGRAAEKLSLNGRTKHRR